MSFGDETGDYSSIYNGNYQSVDSKQFNNKLNIEETYVDKEFKQVLKLNMSDDSGRQIQMPEYATVDITKKREARLRKSFVNDNLKIDDAVIYEDIGTTENIKSRDENNIYELVRDGFTPVLACEVIYAEPC